MPEIRIVHLDPPQPCGVFGQGRETCGQPAEYATIESAPADIAGPGYLFVLPVCRAHSTSMHEHYNRPTYTENFSSFSITVPADAESLADIPLPDMPVSDLILVTATVKLPAGVSPAILEMAAQLIDDAIARMMKDSQKLRERARRALEGN
jgi:hypothetical protein